MLDPEVQRGRPCRMSEWGGLNATSASNSPRLKGRFKSSSQVRSG